MRFENNYFSTYVFFVQKNFINVIKTLKEHVKIKKIHVMTPLISFKYK